MKLLSKEKLQKEVEAQKDKDMLEALKLARFVEKKRKELGDLKQKIEDKKLELLNL